MRHSNPFQFLIVFASLLFLYSCGSSNDKTGKISEMGSRVEAGHLIYTVFETQWLPQIGAGDTARVPKNRFFLVRFTAVNSGSEELYVPNMTLLDDQGHAVEELQEGDQVPQWVGFVRKVKPADSVSGNVVFDAEPKHYRLRLTDENGDKSTLVDLPLNFNADAPQVPLPAVAPSGSATNSSAPAKKPAANR
jgi:hypothetical protein